MRQGKYGTRDNADKANDQSREYQGQSAQALIEQPKRTDQIIDIVQVLKHAFHGRGPTG